MYICENNTIYGTKFHCCPNSHGKILVNDLSSSFLSEPIDDYIHKENVKQQSLLIQTIDGRKNNGYKAYRL